jgi:hypothetical protein
MGRCVGTCVDLGFNHVLKTRSSTHGCQHIVEKVLVLRYNGAVLLNTESLADSLVESGRLEIAAGVSDQPQVSLAVLQFADVLRRSADRLCHAAAQEARQHGASWREIGEAVGGITPQGAEHRFSPAAKERRSKAAKAEWAGKERRAVPR